MSNSFLDLFILLFLVIIPLVFILLHSFLSSRKRLLLAAIIPVIWTALGIWMIIVRYNTDHIFSSPLALFFLGGDVILAGITFLIRYLKRRRK